MSLGLDGCVFDVVDTDVRSSTSESSSAESLSSMSGVWRNVSWL